MHRPHFGNMLNIAVIAAWSRISETSLNSGRSCLHSTLPLCPWEKAWIHLFFLQLWVSSMADFVLWSCLGDLFRKKIWIQIRLKIDQTSQLRLYIPPTASLQKGKTPQPTSVLDMTLPHLMETLQPWRFGECRVPFHRHCSQIHSDPKRLYLIGSYLWVKQNKLCAKWLMLNCECYIAILETIYPCAFLLTG